jgi:L-ascorbate 6-phosphate lactonase
LWYLGCTAIVLKGADGTILFVDPYLGTGDPPRTVRMIPVPFDTDEVNRADAILATHEHTDHVHGPSQTPLLENGGSFVGPRSALDVALNDESWPDRWDVSRDQFDEVVPGDSLEVGSFTVHVEDAYDPHADGAVSYVITYGDTTVFHAGDSHVADSFSDIGDRYDIDDGLLAYGSTGRLYIPGEEFQRTP